METITIPMQLVPNLQPTNCSFQTGLVMVTPNLHTMGFDLSYCFNPSVEITAADLDAMSASIIRLYCNVLRDAGEDVLSNLSALHKLLRLLDQTLNSLWGTKLCNSLTNLTTEYSELANALPYVKVYSTGKIELKDLPKLEIIKRQSQNRNGVRMHVSTKDDNRVFIEAADYVDIDTYAKSVWNAIRPLHRHVSPLIAPSEYVREAIAWFERILVVMRMTPDSADILIKRRAELIGYIDALKRIIAHENATHVDWMHLGSYCMPTSTDLTNLIYPLYHTPYLKMECKRYTGEVENEFEVDADVYIDTTFYEYLTKDIDEDIDVEHWVQEWFISQIPE